MPMPVADCAFTSPAGHAAARVLLEGDDVPTAIFAGNDMIALGVLRAAFEHGIRVPDELSVVGFDDIEVSRYLYPALTTVGQSVGQLGERAARRLLERIRNPALGAEHQRVEPALVLRESSAPPG